MTPAVFPQRVRVTGDTEHAISRSVNDTPKRVVSNGSSAVSRVGIDEQLPVLGVGSHSLALALKTVEEGFQEGEQP
jgi:hypothetical protein